MKTTPASSIVKTAFIALIACAFGSPLAFAQTRTWVSGVGDDLNPCSRTAPCKTYAGAISKTGIAGEISVLDPGGFGTVTISKSMTIDGSGGPHASSISSGVNGIVINIAAGNANDPQRTVTLRNLSINGTGSSGSIGKNTGLNGITISSALEVNIENCVIANFTQLGIKIVPNANCRVNIKNCIVRNCDTGAVQANPAAGFGVIANISKCSLNNSLFGFRADNNVKALIEDCVIASNSNNGVLVSATSAASSACVSRCAINDTGNNGGGGVAAVGGLSTVRIFACAIYNNATGVLVSGGNAFSSNNNLIKENTTDVSGLISGAGQQ